MVVHDIEKDILYVWLSVIVGFFTCYLVEGAEIWKKDVVQTFTSWWTCKQLFRFHFLVWIPYVCLSQEQNKRHLVKPCRFVFLLDSHFFLLSVVQSAECLGQPRKCGMVCLFCGFITVLTQEMPPKACRTDHTCTCTCTCTHGNLPFMTHTLSSKENIATVVSPVLPQRWQCDRRMDISKLRDVDLARGLNCEGSAVSCLSLLAMMQMDSPETQCGSKLLA